MNWLSLILRIIATGGVDDLFMNPRGNNPQYGSDIGKGM